MKNISLILNGVLVVAVAILYYFQFRGGASSSMMSEHASSLKVAFVHSDSLLKHYDYSKAGLEKLESKSKQLDRDLNARATSLQGEFEAYQRNRNNMTIGQAAAVEEDLTRKRNNLQMYQENLSQQMLMEQEKMNRELYDKVTSYLRRYSKDNGIEVVLKFNPSSDLLYAGDSLDISMEVIKGLNEEFRLEKQNAKPAAGDTTKSGGKK